MSETSQLKAIIWSAMERFSTQGLQVLLSIIIARMVAPSCYGLVAMLNIFLAIGQSLIDSGFTSALIQKKDCKDEDYSTVFWFNLLVSIILYAIIFLCSPFIAAFYNQPELESITKFTTFIFIINAFAIVQRAKLTKKMDFKSQTKASLISVIGSGIVGVILAYLGFGVWALVTQSLLLGIIGTISLWYFSSWIPQLIFSWTSFKELGLFGSRLLLTGLLSTLYNNIYTMVIGKFYTPTELGYFNRMQHLASFPSKNITQIIARAVYPKQCKIQNENELLAYNYIKLLSLSSFGIFPLMCLFAAIAHPLVLILLGEKWIDGAPLLSLVCFAYIFDHIQYFNWQMLSVKGRSDLSLYTEILKKIAAAVILVITIPMGIDKMIMGLCFYSIVDLCIIIPFVHRLLPLISFKSEVKALWKPLFSSICMYIVVLVILPLFANSFLQIFFGVVFGVIIYLLICTILRMPELKYIMNLFYKNKTRVS